MKSKPQKAPRRSLLQRFELIEITDPAEQAALDRRIAAAEKLLAERAQLKQTKPRKRK